MGVLQWRRLRVVVESSATWIAVTAVAWTIGVALPVIASSIIPHGWPPVLHIGVAVAAAVAMGATVGAITGRTLARFHAAARAARSAQAASSSIV